MKLFISVWATCNLLTACFDTCLVQNPDIPQAGRVGAPGGVAGRDRAGLYANRTVRLGDNPFSYVPSKASKTRRLNVSPEARTSEILCKPMEEQSPRLTTGASPVYHRFITGLSPGREALFLPGC